MNRYAFAAASTAALITATPVLAQDDITVTQAGLDHTVSIDQVEDVLNSITVTQAGQSQSATISQRNPGMRNTAFSLQGDIGGAGSNSFSIVQSGSDNLFAVGQNSATNFSNVAQFGDSNEAFIDQGFVDGTGDGGEGNNTFLIQEGSGNIASVEQNFTVTGGGNDADIFQIGDNNLATIGQEGLSNVAFIVQGDLGGAGMNTATVTQEGNGNILAIGQNGTLNEAVGFQQGNNNEMFIDQGFNNATGSGGDGNYAEGRQIGNDNTLTINQNMTTSGGNNSAIITQLGNGLELTIEQEGSGHVIELVQDS